LTAAAEIDKKTMMDLCTNPLVEITSVRLSACKDETMSASAPVTIVTPPSSPKPCKSVRWATEEKHEIPIRSPLESLSSEEEWQSMWYDAHTLEDFRAEVRTICRNIRTQSRETLHALARKSFFRGMEQRTSMERQRRKFWPSSALCAVKSSLLATVQVWRPLHKSALHGRRFLQWRRPLATMSARMRMS
jgi:hypothetical protein